MAVALAPRGRAGAVRRASPLAALVLVLALAVPAPAAAEGPREPRLSAAPGDLRLETDRPVAGERERLHAARGALEATTAALGALRSEAEVSRALALSWLRRVRDLEARSRKDGFDAAEADRTHVLLVGDLQGARAALGEELTVLDEGTTVVAVPDVSDAPLRDPELDRERDELAASARQLRELEGVLRWELATARRDAVVSMNRMRLRLLPLLSPAKRASLRGAGPEAISQAGREASQILLELRYHRHALPRLAEARLAAAGRDPLSVAVGALKLLLLLAVFRWWRRRADGVLRNLQARLRESGSGAARGAWSFVWVVHRVRRPLEWLALVAILSRSAAVSEIPELGYVVLVLLWALGGWLGMKLLDAAAARRGDTEATAALRWKSLRLVGLTGVALGLLLSVAERSVGRGTLYGWLGLAAWLVVPPIVVILVAWWRPIVFSRLRVRENRGALLDGVVARADGISSFPAAAVGGLWLVLEGAVRFLGEQAERIEPVRRVLTWLFRREVERKEAARLESDELPPLADERRASLAPERRGESIIDGYAREELDLARDLLAREGGSTIAIVGERGIGKSTFLERLAAAGGWEAPLRVSCRPDGFDGLVADLSAAAGMEGKPGAEKLAGHLRDRRPRVVCVDDVQRIVRPVIGGLADVDRLLALARTTGPSTSWVLAIGKPGYGYLERARGGRVTFDRVLKLDPWSTEQIAQLVRERTREAGIEPGFDELVATRGGEDLSAEARRERTEKDYYALLADASGGNPAVALHAWRESLRQRPGSGEVVVRLPDVPGAEDLDDLPISFFFILRAILQLELASEADVARSTDIRAPDVADALRLARVRGVVESIGDRTRITLRWYRAVTQSLRRRHLVAF